MVERQELFVSLAAQRGGSDASQPGLDLERVPREATNSLFAPIGHAAAIRVPLAGASNEVLTKPQVTQS